MRSMANVALELSGLMSLPVKVFKAIADDDSPGSRNCHEHDDGSLNQCRRPWVCTECGDEVGYHELAKAVEDEAGDLIPADDDDDEQHEKAITLVQFARADELDVLLFGQPHYLEPDCGDNKRGKRPKVLHTYVVLRDMLTANEWVAIVRARLTAGGKEHLAAIRPDGDVLVLQHLAWAQDVRDPDFPVLRKEVNPDPLSVAQMTQLGEAMFGAFKPTEHTRAI